MTAPEHPAPDGCFDVPSFDAPTTGRAVDTAAGKFSADAAGVGTAEVGGRFAEGLARVAALADRPLTVHVDAYQHLHADLQAVLADVDSA